MSMSQLEQRDRNSAFAQGRRHGLAIASLLVSLVSFVSLLGAEKAITAIASAHGDGGREAGSLPRKMGTAAIIVSALFLITVCVVLTVFWDKAVDLYDYLSNCRDGP